MTLITYEDWVWSHPNPALVANYMLPGTPTYTSERTAIAQLAAKAWHSSPIPSEIDWVGVTPSPKPEKFVAGRKSGIMRLASTVKYLNIVLNQNAGQFITSSGRVEERWPATGRAAFAVSLVRMTGREWRIATITHLDTSRGLGRIVR